MRRHTEGGRDRDCVIVPGEKYMDDKRSRIAEVLAVRAAPKVKGEQGKAHRVFLRILYDNHEWVKFSPRITMSRERFLLNFPYLVGVDIDHIRQKEGVMRDGK